MPELPEVETTLRGISKTLLQNKIASIKVRQASLRWPVPNTLARAKNLSVSKMSRRGKYIVADTSDGSIIIHLGMSGSLRLADQPVELRKHDHVIFSLTNKQSLIYHDPRRFGCILHTHSAADEHALLKDLGPEPLGNQFNGQWLFDHSRKKKVAVKNFIMNSHVVVGVGNIYASESLFLAGIRPGKAAGRITAAEYDDLAYHIRAVLAAAIKQGGTTLRDFVNSDGEPGYFQQTLNVYGREGEPCTHCDSVIKQRTIGQRSTFYCSSCQS